MAAKVGPGTIIALLFGKGAITETSGWTPPI